jgi:hypothetical protein
VIRVVAEGAVVACPVLSVDPSRHTITVLWNGDSPREHPLPVAPDARITVNGGPAVLADLREGAEVSLQLSVDGKTVIGITCPHR